MKNFAFCTITYGEKYISFGDTLIKQVNDLGYHIFVLTNDTKHYSFPNELLTIMEYKKPYFSFHEKRTIVKECLNHYDTAIFLDADVNLIDVKNIDVFQSLDPGLHIFANFGTVENTFLNDDICFCQDKSKRNTKYGKEGLDLLNKFGYSYTKDIHGGKGYLEHFLEGRWAIKKDNYREKRFFEIWDILADFCEKKDIEFNYVENVGAGEGGVMSIAAYNSGIRIHSVSPLTSFVCKHFISNYVEKLNNLKPWCIAG